MQKEGKPLNPIKLDADISQMKFDKKRLFFNRLKRRVLKHTWVIRSFFLAGAILLLYLAILTSVRYIGRTNVGYYFGLTKDFIFTPEGKIASQEGRTNILILGKGGEGHEAPDLTDTIIFASVNHEEPSIDLISLPRDIWITDLRTKLNSVYYWGNKKQNGGGIVLAKASVEEIMGQPVHYALLVDFSGFKRIIDVLGGIEVEVERSFVDDKYPIAGRENDLCDGDLQYKCRYETIAFEKGAQRMDGETALKFVRSRNAEGDEGTDFARAARQQKILSAIKNKALSREVLTSARKLLELKKALEDTIEGDINSGAGAILARRAFSSRDSIDSHVLPEDFLERPPYSPKYDNLYVFIPKKEDWSEIHEWVKSILI